MKRILVIGLTFLILLSSCSKKDSWDLTLDEWQLVDLEKELKTAGDMLEKAWISWEKLESSIESQKKILQDINSFTWEDRKFYTIQTKLMPEIVKLKESESCNDKKDLEFFTQCMVDKDIKLSAILWYIPKELQESFKSSYYQAFYSKKSNLLKKTEDSTAISVKKNIILELVFNWSISTQSDCDKLPEPETKSFCSEKIKK